MVLVGDFGLATSSLAAVDPSDVASPSITMEADMTLGSFCLRVLLSSRYSDYNLAEVGTRLYIAPKVQSRRRGRGPRDHSKADMYSLGVRFFSSPSPVIPTCFSYTGIRRLYSSR